MRKILFWCWCLGLPSILWGCNNAPENTPATDTEPNTEPVAATTSTKTRSGKTGKASAAPAPTAPPRITRREEVPNGIVTPEGLRIPRGFKINRFATGLTNPRRLVVAPGATPKKFDVFVSESSAGCIRILRESNGDGSADQKFIFTGSANQPYGIAFHPAGWVYIGNTDSIVRFPYRNGAVKASAKPQFIAPLTQGGYNQHWTRNLLFSRDAKKLYVTVGSSCNTCEEDDSQRAAISIMNPDGRGRRLFATGLRNPVGMDWRPGTNELWSVINERDRLGDNVPPDYLTRVKDGAFYGWPYAYTDIDGAIHPDPNFGDKAPGKVRSTTAPTVPVQAHSAALGLAFYPTAWRQPGARPFPAPYSGDAFLAYHGSWNRSDKTGYKIVRVDFQNGHPVSVTDFVRGYLKDGSAWGRPVDVAIAPDGSLLFSDDEGGIVWRVSYTGSG